MNAADIELEVIHFIKDKVHLENAIDVNAATPFEALGLDSMDIIQLLFDAEDTFGIQFDEQKSKGFTTVGDIVAYIIEQKVQKP